MLFSSNNNCNNSSIETIIKDKITLIDNNNNNNLINLNLTSNLNNTLTNLNNLSNLSLNNKPLNNNENATILRNSICSKSSSSGQDFDPVLVSPLEKANAKEIIQQKIIDNVYITQKINKENQELAKYLVNFDENDIKIKEQSAKNNVLLSPIDLDLISNNSNDIIFNNGLTTNGAYATPNLSVNPFIPTTPEQNDIFLNSNMYSPESQNDELPYPPSNDLMSLENILNNSPSTFIAATANAATTAANGTAANVNTIGSVLSTPESSLLSSPLNNTIISSPETNILSSPELFDTLSPELNIHNNVTLNDLTFEEYLLHQEIIKMQQEALMNSNLMNNVENQVSPCSLFMGNNSLVASPVVTNELLNNTLEPLPLEEIPSIEEIPSLEVVPSLEEVAFTNKQNSKRKFEEFEEEKEENDETKENNGEEELEIKKAKKDSIINEGKPFIYVITESDDEEDCSSEDDNQRKKKYKKKYYVCSVCNHKSKRHYNVEVHLKTHEKNRPRPFTCEVCQKCFCRSHDLERHKIIHQEKMFSCELCGKKFGRLDSLKRHVGCKTCIKRQQLLKNEM